MKRTAEKQITKDTVEDTDADAQPREGFAKAAPEVLRKRRILKARRSGPTEPAGEAPAPSPFAALVKTKGRANGKTKEVEPKSPPPADVKTPAEAEKTPVEKTAKAESPAKENAVETKEKDAEKTEEAKKETPEPEAVKPKDATPKAAETEAEKPETAAPKSDEKAPDAPASEEKPAVEEAPKADSPPSKSAKKAKQAPAPEKKAEEKKTPEKPATAPDATAKPVPASATNGTSPAKRLPFMFGGTASVTSFADAAAKSATSGFSFTAKPVVAPAPSSAEEAPRFEEKPVETGEDGEEERYRARAKVYCLEDGAWRERGVGQLKLNVGGGSARLLMRTEATLRLTLNAPLFAGFRLDRAADRAVRFHDVSGDSPKCFLVRFANKTDADGLAAAVEKCIPALPPA